jgi:hypothetical protein
VKNSLPCSGTLVKNTVNALSASSKGGDRSESLEESSTPAATVATSLARASQHST